MNGMENSEGELLASLKGTTHRVYVLILKRRKPIGNSEVQRALGLSSPSVSLYHIRKLLQMGLIREEEGGYVVDKVVMENIVRIRRMSFPVQAAYVAFFSATLVIFSIFLRPLVIDSVYFLALVVNGVALAVSLYETMKTLRSL